MIFSKSTFIYKTADELIMHYCLVRTSRHTTMAVINNESFPIFFFVNNNNKKQKVRTSSCVKYRKLQFVPSQMFNNNEYNSIANNLTRRYVSLIILAITIPAE